MAEHPGNSELIRSAEQVKAAFQPVADHPIQSALRRAFCERLDQLTALLTKVAGTKLGAGGLATVLGEILKVALEMKELMGWIVPPRLPLSAIEAQREVQTLMEQVKIPFPDGRMPTDYLGILEDLDRQREYAPPIKSDPLTGSSEVSERSEESLPLPSREGAPPDDQSTAGTFALALTGEQGSHSARSEESEKLAPLPSITESPASHHCLADTPGPVLAGETTGQRCYACGSDAFWCSIYGPVICSRCHPPASTSLVAGTFRVGETLQEWAARSRLKV
jgi:hypothetical protein